MSTKGFYESTSLHPPHPIAARVGVDSEISHALKLVDGARFGVYSHEKKRVSFPNRASSPSSSLVTPASIKAK